MARSFMRYIKFYVIFLLNSDFFLSSISFSCHILNKLCIFFLVVVNYSTTESAFFVILFGFVAKAHNHFYCYYKKETPEQKNQIQKKNLTKP